MPYLLTAVNVRQHISSNNGRNFSQSFLKMRKFNINQNININQKYVYVAKKINEIMNYKKTHVIINDLLLFFEILICLLHFYS